MKRCFFILAALCFCLGHGSADLTLTGPKCGIKVCDTDQYCSEYDNQCQPCKDICDADTHNFDSTRCIKECQDYIHDVRYVRKQGILSGADNEDNLRDEINKLERYMTIVVTFLGLVFAGLVIWCFIKLYRFKQKKNITIASIKNKLFPSSKTGVVTTMTSEKTVSGVTVTTASGKPAELRLEMPTSHSDGPPTTITTITTRHPAEDSALDYAYDNPAMAGTPSPGTRQHQSTF